MKEKYKDTYCAPTVRSDAFGRRITYEVNDAIQHLSSTFHACGEGSGPEIHAGRTVKTERDSGVASADCLGFSRCGCELSVESDSVGLAASSVAIGAATDTAKGEEGGKADTDETRRACRT